MESDFRKLGICVLTLLLTTGLAFGQGITTGSISGTVQDQQGAVVSGASVTAKNISTNLEITTTTNDDGLFAFRALPVGTYTITVEAANFRKLVISNVAVSVARDTALGAQTLSVGAATAEVVNVVATTPLVESTTSQIGATFDTSKAATLPIGGGFDALAFYTPGVVTAGSNAFSNSNGADISVNGQRGRSNNFQIDGQNNNDNSVAGPAFFLSNQDTIAEFTVITNNFGVEYGRNSGSIINYVTKSGTNDFHGSVFEYYTGNWGDSLRNSEKSSLFGNCAPGEDPNVTGCTVPTVPRYVENRWGGTLGGPIKQDKIWFFTSFLGNPIRAGGVFTSEGNDTPTPTGLTQLEAAFPGNLAVGAVRTIGPYSVSIGNPTPFSPHLVTVTDGVTTADVEFGGVTRNIPSIYDEYEVTARADFQITDKDRFFIRYLFENSNSTGGFGTGRFAAGTWVDIPARSQFIGLDWTRSWTPRFVNQARFSFERLSVAFEGGSICETSSVLSCPTGINFFSNDLNFGTQNNLPQFRVVNNTQWQDNASWVIGRHNLKFGGEYQRQRSPNFFLPQILGSYFFVTFDDFLADSALQLSLAEGPTGSPFKEQDASFYFGDDWRIRDNLTLNLGIRWEFTEQAINLLNKTTTAQQTGPNPFWDTTLPLNLTTVAEVPNDTNNFAPSIGFAWTPRIFKGLFGEDKTVIRGGYRIAYDPAFYNIFLNVATAAPVVNSAALVGAAATLPTTGFTGADTQSAHLGDMPRGVNPGLRNQTRVSPNFHNPYTQQWSAGIQRELNRHLAAEVRYVGNHTVGNFQTINGNPALQGLAANFPGLIPSGVTPCTDPTQPGFSGRRADCNFRNVRVRANSAWSKYHGMQSELRINAWHGLTGNVAYTWSKTMDNVSEIFSTATGATTVAGAQNPFDISLGERSESGLSFPHVLSIYWLYELPWMKNQEGLIGRVLGGWQVSGTYRYTSGQLWTPAIFPGANSSCQTSFDNTFFGISTCRPFAGDPAAPVDTVGQVCDGSNMCLDSSLSPLPSGTIVSFYDPCLFSGGTGSDCASVPASTRWIFNDDIAAAFFGTPYGNVRRNPGVRGENISTVSMGLQKNVKLSEKWNLRLDATVVNLFNTQFRGVPDPFIEDGNFAERNSSFANTFFNDNGGDYGNITAGGIGRRRLTVGARLTF